ncbi:MULTISPECIES: Do family serine endopeptidase [Sulfurimonas]|uniref:Do family serine endopeptidase n=1 Tax=Sulfurimonas diazotrophicus TaxID=3131939 RepID=A0ABZ3HEA9_9BACT
MPRRYLLLSSILSAVLTLQAAAVTFDEMPPVTKRVMPNGPNEVLSFSPAVERAKASIVYISSKQTRSQKYMEQMHPFFEQFFGRRYNPNPHRQSLGSGVIVTKDGYIVTNNHVVEDADTIMVKLPDSQKEYRAKLVGSDPKSDIAVIRIDAEGLTPIRMGSSAELQIGDIVFAIGNPFGVGLSVSQGIVSAQHKSGIGINEYENFIQTDASINPGNSGGALVDSRGALIGINSAIITRSGGNNGIGFAIEVDMVKSIAKKLIEDGSVTRGYLGVSIGNMTKELQSLYKHEQGALLNDIVVDSPAAKAGLKRGDLIIAVDGDPIRNAADLKNRVGMYRPGSRVKITYERDGDTDSVYVNLTDLGEHDTNDADAVFEGVSLQNIDAQQRYRLRIPDDVEGVLVTEVDAESDAAMQGIRPGDIIVQLENTPVTDIASLVKAHKNAKGKIKRVYVYRKGQVYVVALP